MQINALSTINFESKKGYYISPSTRENAQTLLMLMKRSTTHKNNAITGWQTEILSSLNIKNKVKFSNARLFIRKTDNPEQNKKLPDCTLMMGKNFLHINSSTGEVVSHSIGIFTSLNKLIRKADKYIKEFLENFNNPDVVKRNTFETGGYIELT